VSLMKRYAEDMRHLTERARDAAWKETAAERMSAIRTVYEDCGTAATVYADPIAVAEQLVTAVTREFLRNRKQIEYRLAG